MRPHVSRQLPVSRQLDFRSMLGQMVLPICWEREGPLLGLARGKVRLAATYLSRISWRPPSTLARSSLQRMLGYKFRQLIPAFSLRAWRFRSLNPGLFQALFGPRRVKNPRYPRQKVLRLYLYRYKSP